MVGAMIRKCSRCRIDITPEELYEYRSRVYCENCCLDILNPKVRKTHWQYLQSISTDYLLSDPGQKRTKAHR